MIQAAFFVSHYRNYLAKFLELNDKKYLLVFMIAIMKIIFSIKEFDYADI